MRIGSGEKTAISDAKQVFICISLTVLFSTVGLNQSAIARSDAEEKSEAGKVHTFVNRAILDPARGAQAKGEYERALALYQRAVAILKDEKYQDQLAKNVQESSIFDCLKCESAVLVQMGRYDEAANIYLDFDKKSPPLAGQPNRSNAFEAGGIFLTAKLYDKARPIFEDIVASAGPMDVLNARAELAKIDRAQGDEIKAEGELTQLLADKRFTESWTMMRALRVRLREAYTIAGKAGEAGEANKIEAILKDKHCPKCGSDKNVLPIVYGLHSGRSAGVHPGGCLVDQYSPRWWCETDSLEF